MDEQAIRRAALRTLRRAIRERFPQGVERIRWLRWAARVAKSSTPAQLTLPLQYAQAASSGSIVTPSTGGPHDASSNRILESQHSRTGAQRLGTGGTTL